MNDASTPTSLHAGALRSAAVRGAALRLLVALRRCSRCGRLRRVLDCVIASTAEHVERRRHARAGRLRPAPACVAGRLVVALGCVLLVVAAGRSPIALVVALVAVALPLFGAGRRCWPSCCCRRWLLLGWLLWLLAWLARCVR